jgi:hypothetical protein
MHSLPCMVEKLRDEDHGSGRGCISMLRYCHLKRGFISNLCMLEYYSLVEVYILPGN